jgi:hypothetical protein
MRITDFTELTTPTSNDLLVVVDVVNDITKKLKLSSLPVPSSVTTALATKQDSLVSGTNIKTINSTSVLGSGNIAVQETLVSGTNIKTINSTSLLGSGNITIAANPSGVAGAIQFSDGSAFASDAANLFWDDTNNRLGVGTNTPTATTHIRGVDQLQTSTSLFITDSIGTELLRVHNSANNSAVVMTTAKIANYEIISGNVLANTSMRFVPITTGLAINKDYSSPAASTLVHIKGSGATSATTSLLVQNSAGTTALIIRDDGSSAFSSNDTSTPLSANAANSATIAFELLSINARRFRILGTSSLTTLEASNTGGITTNAALNVGGSAAAQASAILQADSTTRGFLPPRMTTTQKNAIATPAAGLVVYDSTTNKLCCYNGSTWNDLF